jgi:CheY-like chemotaxis protein
MSEETMKRMFEPFFTTKFQGRGLGMAAVYGIIKNHDGWITADSEPGKGTKISIYIPAASDNFKEELIISEPAKGTGTILLIDDEDIVIEISEAMLERLGYSIISAKTGKDAIDLVRTYNGNIDLVLLDLGMPDMGGDAIYLSLKEARPEIKVIICSGYGVEGLGQDILNAGAHGYIQKPFSLNGISEKLKQVLYSN